MWIEKRKDCYRMYERYTGIDGKTHKVSVRMERDTPQQRNIARKKLDRQIEKNRQLVSNHLTFRELSELYLYKKKSELKESTHRRNSHECKTLNSLFGDVLVEDLTSSLVRARIVKHSTRPSMANEHIKRFKEIIKWGYQHDLVENPSFIDKILLLKDKSRREKVADKFLEKEECEKLVQGMTPTGELLTRFLILSGLRVGEALALTIDDVDLEKREITVNKSKDAITGSISTPKTFCSIRQVFIQDELLEVLQVFKKRLGIANEGTEPFFLNESGRPMEYNAYRQYLRTVSIRNLGRPITPHVLRHTHASLLAEHAIDDKLSYEMISRRLGHENSKITKDIYIHVTENLKKKDNDAIRGVVLM